MDRFRVIVEGEELECVLNPRTEETKKIIHILITTLCNRNCKFCCNKLCDKNYIEYVTDQDLRECETLCLTGGEPFLYSNPNKIAEYYKTKYPNIKRVFVYSNAIELADYLNEGGKVNHIDGISLSIKIPKDITAFDETISSNPDILKLTSNLCYYFDDLKPKTEGNFTVIPREWQTLQNYRPNPDSIFRKI